MSWNPTESQNRRRSGFIPPTNLPCRRPRPSSLINPVALLLAIPSLTFLILFFLLPPFLSHTNQIIRPNSGPVRKSWDSINILLVFFAILCGVFARRDDEAPPSDEAAAAESQVLGSVLPDVSRLVNEPRQSVPAWLDYPDPEKYNYINLGDVSSDGGRLRSSSSTYSDLRQESLWKSGGGNRSRFSDDLEVSSYRSPPPPVDFERRPRRRSHDTERGEAEVIVKEIPLHKLEDCSTRKAPNSPTPPQPPLSTATMKWARCTHSVPHRGDAERHRDEAEVITENRRPVPPPAQPPPLATKPDFQFPAVVNVNVHRRKSDVAREIAPSIASLYKGQRKRSGKSRNICGSAAHNSSPPSPEEPRSAPPPPPPPRRPPSAVMQNLLKKRSKSKRVHSVPTIAAPPPPPQPLPQNSIFNNLFKTGGKSKRFLKSPTAPPTPPPPTWTSLVLNSLFKNASKSRRFKNAITSPPPAPPPPPPAADTSRLRPLNREKLPKPLKPTPQNHEDVLIVPPPLLTPQPPPPFRVTEAKFVYQRELLRTSSARSSRCSSPELDELIPTSQLNPTVETQSGLQFRVRART